VTDRRSLAEATCHSAAPAHPDARRAHGAFRKVLVGALAGLTLLGTGVAAVAALVVDRISAPGNARPAALLASFPAVPGPAPGSVAVGAPMIPIRRAHERARPTRRRRKSATKSPAVTTQPRSASVAAGRVASFTATAAGTPAPRARWQRSANRGRTWRNIAGAHGVTYAFTASSSENGYEYRAVFSNSAGSATTSAARLTVTAPPSGSAPQLTTPPASGSGPQLTTPPASGSAPQLTTQPASESAQSGTTATFTAAASGSPTPSVQWESSSDGGSSWSEITGATSTSYSFTATSAQNDDEYRAVFSNSAGSATTNAATLTVTAPPSGEAPQLTTQPTSQTVAVDAWTTFTAAASGDPTPSVQWEVSSDGGSSWSEITGATSTSYSFTATSAQNDDEYRAAFTNSAGSATTNAATLTVAEESGNWSGYAATGGRFSSVSGSWTVPIVTCPADTTTYSSQWIGIDGYESDTVEQDGILAACLSGTPYYRAWYEMYGDEAVDEGAEVPLSSSSYPVSPGDGMTASVSLSGSTWTLAIADTTRDWNYSIDIASPSPAPEQSSAEWIAERPELGSSLTALSDFGSVSFTGASATDGTTSGPISAFSFQPIEMNGSTLLAAPGALDPAGESFTDNWYASS
jgi:hypothetical protein